MADYRFIPIEDDDIEDEDILIPQRINLPHNNNNNNNNNVEHDDVTDDEDDVTDSDDYDDDDDEDEFLIPEIVLPVNIERINELDDDDDDDDYDDVTDDEDDDVDDDDDDDDDEEEDDEDEDDDEEDDEEEEEVEELMVPERVDSSSVIDDISVGVVMENSNTNEFDGRKEEVNKCEIDGLICPICYEAWTSGGLHQISCLPCGHIYGLSCIKKWLLQRKSSGKCPQCNQLCTFKDVRVLYVSRLCVADEELHKRVRSLEAKCAYLEQKAVPITHDELINQICGNPTLVERLATALADLH